MTSDSPAPLLNLLEQRLHEKLKNIKDLLKKINQSSLSSASTEGQTNLQLPRVNLKLQEELAALVVLLPRLEKLLIKLDKSPWQRFLKFFNLSSEQEEIETLFEYIEIAIEIVYQNPQNLEATRNIRIEIERTVNRYEHPLIGIAINRFMDIYRSESEPLKVFSGLAFTTCIAVGLLTLSFMGLYRKENNLLNEQMQLVETQIDKIKGELAKDGISINDKGEVTQNRVSVPNQNDLRNDLASVMGGIAANQKQEDLIREYRDKTLRLSQLKERINRDRQDTSILFIIVLVVSSGTLGSVISILIRISEFEREEVADPLIPIFMGAFKPIIGSSFGLLIYALFSSGIISLQIVPSETVRGREFFFCSIAFVVGFSERLAKDVIKRTENTLLGAIAPLPSPPEQAQKPTETMNLVTPKETPKIDPNPPLKNEDFPDTAG